MFSETDSTGEQTVMNKRSREDQKRQDSQKLNLKQSQKFLLFLLKKNFLFLNPESKILSFKGCYKEGTFHRVNGRFLVKEKMTSESEKTTQWLTGFPGFHFLLIKVVPNPLVTKP